MSNTPETTNAPAKLSKGQISRAELAAEEAEKNRVSKLGFLSYLRSIERRSKGKPRIGKNTTLREEAATIGQDPYLAFPTSDFSSVEEKPGKPARLRSRVLGLFGPQGALPINTTEEVYRWVRGGDEAFVRFADIFATRFQQLFFRSWSDSRAITQFDHPDSDRFQAYVGAIGGFSTPAFLKRDSIDDTTRLSLVSLYSGRIKSPVRLRQMIELYLGDALRVSVEEHVPVWMEMEASATNRLGMRGASLGRDMHLGSKVQSINEKIRLNIQTDTLASYRTMLPGGENHARLRDIVHWYLGFTTEVDIALSLPADQVAPAKLGQTAELGYMACIAPNFEPANKNYIQSASYTLEQDRAQNAA
ncbi:MAG: type VI secretion system baseplate subunit TssG [Paracoccaceae bacterium]